MKFKQAKNETFDDYHRRMLSWGAKHHKVFPYPKSLFDALRPYSVGGIPASIMLFVNELCNGKCYDRSVLIQLALNNCQIVHADINSLRNVKDGHHPEHSFVETTDFGHHKSWVIDTSIGLIFDKKFYYKLENPTINTTISKEQCMDFIEIKEIIASNFEHDKYSLPLTLPIIEEAVKQSFHLGTIMYKDLVLNEIESFKAAIDYDGIVSEIEADMQLLKEGRRDEVDKKFGIVRDEYGREISRNGVPNPYYKSAEQIEEENAYFESIKNDPQKLNEYFATLGQQAEQERLREEAATSAIARQRLEEIKQNPTANFYDNLSISHTATTNSLSQPPQEQ